MNLFMVHVGFYDKTIGEGIYESHINFFVIASNPKEAKEKTLKIKEFEEKKMHIDGIKEISSVDGYKIILKKDSSSENGEVLTYEDSKHL